MIISILIYLYSWSLAAHWSPQDRQVYEQRRFVELISKPHVRRDQQMVDLLLRQQKDLVACRSIKEGHGGLNGVVRCIRFLNTEVELQLHSPGRDLLANDLNVLCEKMVNSRSDLKLIMKSGVFRVSHQSWQRCVRWVWRQIFLTTTANFAAQPLEAIALVREANANLATDNHWKIQTLKRFDIR